MGEENLNLDTERLSCLQQERLDIARRILLHQSTSTSSRTKGGSKEPKDVTGWYLHEKALLRSLKSLHFSCEVSCHFKFKIFF